MASSETEPLLFIKDGIEVAGEILDFLLSFRQTLTEQWFTVEMDDDPKQSAKTTPQSWPLKGCLIADLSPAEHAFQLLKTKDSYKKHLANYLKRGNKPYIWKVC